MFRFISQSLLNASADLQMQAEGFGCSTISVQNTDGGYLFGRNFDWQNCDALIVASYGCHHGGVAERTQDFLKSIGKEANYINTIIMMDNALIVFDMDQQRSIDPEKKVDEHIAQIKADIDAGKNFIQPAPANETDFYRGYTDMVKKNGPMYSFPLYCVTDACVGCGTCTKVCPMGCIHLEDRKPAYDYTNCANCMACIHACPTKAIQFAAVKEPNPNARYRNPNITLKEIITANSQS